MLYWRELSGGGWRGNVTRAPGPLFHTYPLLGSRSSADMTACYCGAMLTDLSSRALLVSLAYPGYPL